MTRFARAKGSKASNERLPESATSWSEMKKELLNKNKELEEKKNREKALEQRQANYQDFLREKEEEEDKNTSWADFSETRHTVDKKTTLNKSKKGKLNVDNNKKRTISPESISTNKKVKKMKMSVQQNGDDESENSDEEFSALKAEIDKVLSQQQDDNSDSDAPPEEASTKEKPPEIIVKKTKKPKQKLQILINPKGKFNKDNKEAKTGLKKKSQENEMQKKHVKTEHLSDKDKKKIEKKQERYRKQLEKKKLTKQKKLQNVESIESSVDTNSDLNKSPTEKETISHNGNEIDVHKLEKKLARRKKQKEKKLKKKLESGLINTTEDKKEDKVLTEKDLLSLQKKKDKRARQVEKRKKFKEAKKLAAKSGETEGSVEQPMNGNVESNNSQTDINKNNKFQDRFNRNENSEKPSQEHIKNQKERKPKLKNQKDFERTKPKSEVMFINGKTVEIDYIDGFPIKKEDAERLKKLRKEMISKGLPRSEINIALKLERRRAEKALAREKKNVCFNCRKSGHNLSECPALDKDQVAQTSGTGICFKCGSTEHTHFECKVVKGLDYKFATCFICKEQGHIARQCPDNQRGLYPKGGACKECGDVTHLKKDCPKYQIQQAQLKDNLSIETMDNRNPDDLGSKWESKTNSLPVKRVNKKIKF